MIPFNSPLYWDPFTPSSKYKNAPCLQVHLRVGTFQLIEIVHLLIRGCSNLKILDHCCWTENLFVHRILFNKIRHWEAGNVDEKYNFGSSSLWPCRSSRLAKARVATIRVVIWKSIFLQIKLFKKWCRIYLKLREAYTSHRGQGTAFKPSQLSRLCTILAVWDAVEKLVSWALHLNS